jgi:hypothetical protein
LLRVIDAQAHVDGSRRLCPVGSGVHHLDAHFFACQQIADVADQTLSVYGDNRECHGQRRRGVGPRRGDQAVRSRRAHAAQTRTIHAVDGHSAADGRVAGDGLGFHRSTAAREADGQIRNATEHHR